MLDCLWRLEDVRDAVRLGPADSILTFWSSETRDRSWTYCAVAHRGDGVWTHLYAIERAPALTVVHLVKFWQGEQLAAATSWMRARRGACPRCIRARRIAGDCDRAARESYGVAA
jgi:hypothetical protein